MLLCTSLYVCILSSNFNLIYIAGPLEATTRPSQKKIKTPRKGARIGVTIGSCCELGAKIAKHGYDECTWSRALIFNLRLLDRQWRQKSPKTGARPANELINVRLLKKCKRFKTFFSKCCVAEKIDNERYKKQHLDYVKKVLLIKVDLESLRKDKFTGETKTKGVEDETGDNYNFDVQNEDDTSED